MLFQAPLRTQARHCLLLYGGGLGLLAGRLLVVWTGVAGAGLGPCLGSAMAGVGEVCSVGWGCRVAALDSAVPVSIADALRLGVFAKV